MYVLDTNTLIYFFKNMGQVAERMRTVAPDDLAIPTVVLFELYVGIAKSQNPAPRKQLLGDFASQSVILPFDQKAARSAAQVRTQLEQSGQPIGPMDVLIAGIAMAQEAILVTHNVKEFSRINSLLIEDWY